MVDLTGRKDAVAIKQRYQERLDKAHQTVFEKKKWLYEMNHKLKNALSDMERLERDISSNEEERGKLYSSLQNLLKQETDFEKDIWKTTQAGRKVKTINIKQKFTDSDVETNYDAMQEYLRRYPKYTSKSSFREILTQITQIEAGIKHTKQDFSRAIANANKEISYFPRNILEAKHRIAEYDKILDEAQKKLSLMRYTKSMLFRISSERSKLGVTIDTLHHTMEDYKVTVDRIDEEVNEAKGIITKLQKRWGFVRIAHPYKRKEI